MKDSLFKLLYNSENFRKFMEIHNETYKKTGIYKERSYEQLIQKYNSSDYASLFDNSRYINLAYDALKEFKMDQQGARLVPYSEFESSIINQISRLVALNRYRLEELKPDRMLEYDLFAELKTLFQQLKVMASSSKLVGFSKALHFLLPNLVMPVDRASVLNFCLGSDSVPSRLDEQFAKFEAVFQKYNDLSRYLGLNIGNSDGNWWNLSVPKRIDNAILGCWMGYKEGKLKLG